MAIVNPTRHLRGNCAKSQHFPRVTADGTHEHHFDGGRRGQSAAAADEVAFEFVRLEPPYLLCIPLRSPLVRSMECEVVCGLLPDHVSSSSAAKGSVDVPDFGIGYGVHGGTACGHSASRGRSLSVFPALGETPRRVNRGPGECLSRFGELSGLFRRAIGHDVRRSHLSKRSSIPVRMGPIWQVEILSKGERAFHGCCCRSPCNAALRFNLL